MRATFGQFSLRNIWDNIKTKLSTTQNVYFISGMCYNCSVFDNIILPKGFEKIYIEWEIPQPEESIESYALRMAKSIDTHKKFILIGYSFGGIIVQEIAKFLKPEKVIIISSMKDEAEIPNLFELAKKVNFADNLPTRIYSTSNFMINLFNRYVYNIPTSALGDFMTMIDPTYIRWSLRQITHWKPSIKIPNIYHIHGTRDQVFPYDQVIDAKPIIGGDHLMVAKRAKEVSQALENVLNEREKKGKKHK